MMSNTADNDRIRDLQTASDLKVFGPFTLALLEERVGAQIAHGSEVTTRSSQRLVQQLLGHGEPIQLKPSDLGTDLQLLLGDQDFWNRLQPVYQQLQGTAASGTTDSGEDSAFRALATIGNPQAYLGFHIDRLLKGLVSDQLIGLGGQRLTQQRLERQLSRDNIQRYIGSELTEEQQSALQNPTSFTYQLAREQATPNEAEQNAMRESLLQDSIGSAMELYTLLLMGGNAEMADQMLGYAEKLRGEQEQLQQSAPQKSVAVLR